MRKTQRAFSLIELAVVLAIIGFLLLSGMFALNAQVDQRNIEQTRARLAQARDLLLAYAVVNGRLPCPARTGGNGVVPGMEVRNAAGECKDADGVEDHYGGVLSSGATGGLLPAVTIGHTEANAAGFAVDAWQGTIRYAVAKTVTGCSGTSTLPHFVHSGNLRDNGITCQPSDLLVCKSATGISTSACGGASNQIMAQNMVVAIVFSTGKNWATGPGGLDEQANVKAITTLAPQNHPIFVYHTPSPASATNGEFDDQFIWITAGELYGKLIAAGVLP